MKYRYIFLLILIAISGTLQAVVKVPAIFDSHMVIQQKQVIHIWGWANKKEKVTVQFGNQKKSVTASKDGAWKIDLLPMNAGGPYQLTISGKKNKLVFEDVMIGEVWLCSGQSNMEFVVKNSLNASEEMLQADNPLIRHIKITNTIAAEPSKEVTTTGWQTASPETVGEFTAVGYYFAREIQKSQNVAVGLINSSWGGTYAEAWISHEAMIKLPDYAQIPQITAEKLESYYASFEKKLNVTLDKLGITLANITEKPEEWIKPDFDDTKWMDVNVPEPWDKEILPGFDGVAWYRKSFEIPAEVAQLGITVSLGRIEDNDVVYINGEKVGFNKGNQPMSVYSVPPALLKAGKNTIVVRVEDFWESGGFIGNEDDVYISAKNGYRELLAGTWKMNLGALYGVRIRTPNVHPNVLYNGMIAPIIPYSIKGALWYQGEANASFAYQYRQILPAMITDWRTRWNEGNFPFYIVQLTSYNKFSSNSQNGGSSWAELRESQYETTKLPNVDLVVTTDVGDSADIHPRNKQEVGKRLALLALKHDYGKDLPYHSTVYKNIAIEGNKAVIEFDLFGSGLMAKDRYGYLKGFEIAGADKQFHYAQATIQDNKVVVWASEVTKPVAVRYSWSDNPDGNLFNMEGLPVMPFRTDNWKLSTQENKFNKFLSL